MMRIHVVKDQSLMDDRARHKAHRANAHCAEQLVLVVKATSLCLSQRRVHAAHRGAYTSTWPTRADTASPSVSIW